MTAIATVDQVRELTAPDAPVLIALNRPQLEAAHAKMITFVQGRRARLLADMDEERQALEIALKNKWAVKRHHAALDRMGKKVTFWDKIEAVMAKPALMTAAGNAMTAKVFDEIGVAVDSIRNPSGPDVSFYLGWYFDPSEL